MERVHCLGLVAVEALSRAMGPATSPRSPGLTDSLRLTPSGGAGTAALALAQLGVPVGLFAGVGDDGHGTFVRETLRKAGVEVAHLHTIPGAATPLSYVTLRRDGQRSNVYTPGASQHFAPRDLPRAALWQAHFLYYSDLGALPGWDGAPAAALLAEARQHGLVTVVDINAASPPNVRTFEKVAVHADWVLASDDELAAIYAGRDLAGCLARLRRVGVRQLLLKLGAAGCLLVTGESSTPCPATGSAVTGVSGVGACCAAGFLAGLAQGLSPLAAAQASQLAAAASLRPAPGTRGLPRLAALLARPTAGQV